MLYLIIIVLVLDSIFLYIDRSSLIKERDNAELRAVTHFRKINELEKINKYYQEENVILLENASELRNKVNVLDEIKEIIKSNHFTFDQIDEIKELVDNLQTEN